ncbi:MAG: C25 family cysteine peptidase [Candidatus Poribacteria bacterium]
MTLRTDTATGKEDIVYLNWFEVEYPRAFKAYNNRMEFEIPNQGLYQFKITGFSKPNIEIYKGGFSKLSNVKIERDGVDKTGGVQYAVTFVDEIVQPTKYIALTTENKKSPKAIVEDAPSKLRSSLNGADYIIIVYDDFYEDVLPLAKYRSNQFRVAVVKVQDIYDEFSWGLLTPEAIRAFIRYAYHYWRPPAPSYVLLVGDASWDFRRGKNYVPAYYVHTYKWGQTATDHSYVCVNGDDPLPDLFIGRITTRTKEATRAVVEKIIRYESRPVLGDWRRHLLMLAAAGSFIGDSEQLLRDYVPIDLGYRVARVYTDPNSPYYGDTAQLLDFWNSGSSFVHFTGHGGGHIWADSSLFTLNDVQFLSNKNHPAFVTSFTCFTGYFDDPSKSGLNEKLVNLEEGGAIAAFGSTGLGWVKGDYYMEQGLFKSLFRNGSRRIGQVIVETKVWMLLNTYHSLKVNMISLFNLLGDAASVAPLPQRKMDVIAHFVGDNSTPIAEKWMQVRGVIDDKFNGQALVEVYRDEPTPEELQIYHPDYQTTLRVKNGRFSGRLIKLSGLPSPLTKGVRGLSLRKGKNDEYSTKDITVRCYAWNDEEDEDAVGATVLRIPGKDEIDLSIFSGDIRFTTISSPEGDSSLKVKLQATIYNLGGGDASSVKVSFYSGPPFSGGRIVGTATIPSIAGGQSAVAEIDYTPKVEAETIYVHIDPLNEIIEMDKTNNEAEKKLMFNSYTITPKGNLNDAISSLDGNLIINVPEGAVSAVVQLNVESVAVPGIINQPDLRYAPLPQKADGGAYRLSISDESVINSSGAFSISLMFRYDTNHLDNSMADNLMVYRWRYDENLWEIASEEIQRESGIVKATVHQLGTFSVLHNADSLPPIIQLSITDEQFAYDGVFASQTPTLSAIIEDANGVGKVKVFMNGKSVKQEDVVFSHNPSSINSTVVTFTPTLDFGDYLLAVEASDVNGNASKEELPFKVGGELKLLNVANHPNPFNPPADKETRFTYVLTKPVEDVAIKIYSSSGRLIYQIQDAYQRQGYNEVPWDGKDKDGEDVANGVYFYKIVVKTQDGNLSRIGKLALIR